MKKIYNRMLLMCPLSWYIFIGSLRLSCFMLLCSLPLLYLWGGSMLNNYNMYMTAVSIRETTQAILLIALLLSVIIEDIQS